MSLTWLEGNRGHRGSLQSFECTHKPVRNPVTHEVSHPRMWEYEVQSCLRDIRPPLQPPRFMLLAVEDDGSVAAAAVWTELDGPGAVELEFAAVGRPYRGGGGAVAKEVMSRVFDAITQRAIDVGEPEVLVQGWIWHENLASKRLSRKMGMSQVGWGAAGVEQWEARIPVAGVEPD